MTTLKVVEVGGGGRQQESKPRGISYTLRVWAERVELWRLSRGGGGVLVGVQLLCLP